MDYSALIQNSIEMIEGRLFEKISISELAEQSFFSKHHYQRLFHAIVGEPVMEYIKKRRLLIASIELCESDSTILEIALKHGYSSHEGFTRAFKAYYGLTPTEFRKLGKNNIEKFKMKRSGGIMINKCDRTNFTDSTKFLSVEKHGKLSASIFDVLGILDDFASKAKKLIEFSEKAVSEEASRAVSFSVLTSELQMLLQRVSSSSAHIRAFFDSKTEMLQMQEPFELSERIYSAIKCLEDIGFTMNVLTFNSAIECARMQKPRDKFDSIAEQYKVIANSIISKNIKTVDLILDVIALISIDIQKEAFIRLHEIPNIIDKSAKACGAVADDAMRAASALGEISGRGFISIAGDTKNHSRKIAKIAQRVSESIKNTESANFVGNLTASAKRIKVIISRMDDFSFLGNIIAYNAKIETVRSGNNKVCEDSTKKLLEIPAILNNTHEQANQIIDEVIGLLALFNADKKHDENKLILKSLSDISFQGRILSFQHKLEAERISCITDVFQESAAVCNGAADEFCAFEFEAAQAYQDSIFDAVQIEAALRQYGEQIEKIMLDSNKAAEAVGFQAETFNVISSEHKYFAKRIMQVADMVSRK